MKTIAQQQAEEIANSMHCIYQSDAVTIRAFSVPAGIQQDVAAINEKRKARSWLNNFIRTPNVPAVIRAMPTGDVHKLIKQLRK